jgi:phosphoglycerol transferase
MTLALMAAGLAVWVRLHFGAITFDQIVSNFPVVDAQNVGNTALFGQAVLASVVLPILVMAFAAMLLGGRRAAGKARRLDNWLRLVVPLLAAVVAFGALITTARLPEYVAAVIADRTFEPYYQPPTITKVPAKPKNLITIYLESVEESYSDPAVFGQDLLAGLTAGTAGWATYHGLREDPGGGWTMAGLIGTQCGIPLKGKAVVFGFSPNREGQEARTYLPGATCLGDLLAANGYTNAFVGGADGRFAGKATYLADHGYTIDRGLAEWEAVGEDPANISDWGLSDARTLAHARETLEQLRATGRPYNLTILTLDSHEPPGAFPGCTTGDANPMATALKCSMRAVAAFLAGLEAAGYLEDTVVMLTGDHRKILGASTYYRVELSVAAERTLPLRVWSPDPVTFSRAGADQLSILPTTLELLGFGLPDGRAGLGVSFASAHDLAGTALALPREQYDELVTSPSAELYRRFWHVS